MLIFFGVIIVPIICLLIVNSAVKASEKREKLKIDEKWEKERQRQHEIKLETIKAGKWVFPVKDFYYQCCSLNATDVFDKYHFEKMKKIALDILEKNGVPEESYHYYFGDENVRQYFENGKSSDAREKEELERKEKEEYITPQNAKLDDATKKEIEFNNKLKDLKFEKKREFILTEKANKLSARVTELSKAIEGSKKLSDAVSNSASVEKEHNWALLGGIANGFAGPGAGLAVAADAMKDNERIRQQNAVNKEYATNLSMDIYNAGQNAKGRLKNMRSELSDYISKLNKLKFKTVINDVETKTVYDNLKIEPKIEFDNGIKMNLSVKITNNYNENLPKDFTMVADGTVNIEIYCDGIFVEDVCVPLPLEGVKCNGGSETVLIYPTKYMQDYFERRFTFDVKPNHLWIMEL